MRGPFFGKGEIPVAFPHLVEMVRHRAATQPDEIAYCFLEDGETQEVSMTYKELDLRARALGARLQQIGMAGERALLVYPSCIEYMVGFFGALYAGATAIPLYPPRRARNIARLESVVRDAAAKITLTNEAVYSDLSAAIEKAPALKEVTWLVTESVDNDLADAWQAPELQSEDIAYLQYTSGSTGKPKGVMVSHRNLMVNMEIMNTQYDYGENAVMVHWVPIFHDLGLIFGMLTPVYFGFPCYFFSPFTFMERPGRWMEAVQRYGGTVSCAPNFALDLVVAKTTPEERAKLDLSGLKTIVNASEPVRSVSVENFAEAFASTGFRKYAITPSWGLAEATLLVVMPDPKEEAPYLTVDSDQLVAGIVEVVEDAEQEGRKTQTFVGHARPNWDTEVKIIDPKTLEHVPAGRVGEIWLRGQSITQGYYLRPKATKETFEGYTSDTQEGPFLRTGDLGFIHEEQLYICGRAKDVIIIRGANHYPQDIEYTSQDAHPKLRPGCVAAFSIEIDGEERVVINQEVRKQDVDTIDTAAAIRAIRKAVSDTHEIAVYAVNLLRPGTVPKTSSGKIQRHGSKKAFLEGTLDLVAEWRQHLAADASGDAGQDMPANDNGTAIADWLRKRIATQAGIPVASVDLEEPFDAYGIDSMRAVELTYALGQWLGRKLSPTLVYDYPDIATLAAHLSTQSTFPTTQQKSPGKQSELNEHGPIAIVGMACRFPGANSPQAFWDLLAEGRDALTERPADRWSLSAFAATEGNAFSTDRGGFIDAPADFDAAFFGISPREADYMDPQQRVLLEVSWEAFENAGIQPVQLSGSDTGVYMGVAAVDYARLQAREVREFKVYQGTGTAYSIVANRLSYYYNFRGPSMAIDSACSSSLVAVHQACKDLRNGECSVALAGGVSLLLAPDSSYMYSNGTMLSPDGRCKTFDAGADGYVRSEGCGVIVLKRLADAEADGDNILAVLRGSAVNQDGRSNGISAPNGPAQEAVIRAALQAAQLPATAVSYVEAHGTGTRLGDPIEMNALKAVYGANRAEDNRCHIGSVKTNIGHLEAAAGIAGLMKCVLALRHQQLPRHLNFSSLNPLLTLDDVPFGIPTETVNWLAQEAPLRAGVSSFGFGGTNAHAILEAYMVASTVTEVPENEQLQLFTLSAASDWSLQCYKSELAAYIETEAPALSAVAYALTQQRAHFRLRQTFVAESQAELVAQLKAAPEEDAFAPAATGKPRKIFVFSGQGPQWWGMGRDLMAKVPAFKAELEAIDAEFRRLLDTSPMEELLKDEADSRLFDTHIGQPVIFSLQVALARLWMSWGVQPDGIIGHSMGEVAAAHIAGALSLEDAVKVIYHRGQVVKPAYGRGRMAVISREAEITRELIAPYADRIGIAGINSSISTVISGDGEAVIKLIEELEARDIPCQLIRGKYASHSQQMEAFRKPFVDKISGIVKQKPRVPIWSTVTGKQAMNGEFSPDYFADNFVEPVRFRDAVTAMVTGQEEKYHVFIEMSAHPVLTGNILQNLSEHEVQGLALPSLRRQEPEHACMLSSAGKLYEVGGSLAFDVLQANKAEKRARLRLPTYPWDRQTYWFPRAEGRLVETPSTRQVWDRVLSATQRQAQVGPFDLNPASYPAKWDALNALAFNYIFETFHRIGLFQQAGDRQTVATVLKKGAIPDTYTALIENWLDLLVAAGRLRTDGEGYVADQPLPNPPRPERPEVLADIGFFYDYMERCGEQLLDVLQGKVNPLETLFPNAAYETVEHLYHRWPVARYFNTLVGSAMEAWMQARPDREKYRVLEIGAGTGGTTRQILPVFPPDRTTYHYTDLSEFFFHRVREAVTDYPFVEFGILDISEDPLTQGREAHSYDLILAANVLHATTDLSKTMDNVMRLLAPGGMLVMYELTEHMPWIDVSVALIEGWQLYEDNIRTNCPLVPLADWKRLLRAKGFEFIEGLPHADSQTAVFGQHVIMAIRPDEDLSAPVAKAETLRSDWCYEYVWQEVAVDSMAAIHAESWELIGAQPAGLSELEYDTGGKWLMVSDTNSKNITTTLECLQARQQSGLPAYAGIVFLLEGLSDTAHPDHAVATQWVAFARVLRSEYPDTAVLVIDGASSLAAGQLAAALHAGEVELSYDTGQPRALRLRGTHTGQSIAPQRLVCSDHAAYLITGGTGALGMEVAERLVERGAGELILLARTAFPPRDTWAQLDAKSPFYVRIRRMLDWVARGTRVRLLAGDVADEALYGNLETEFPVRGVIHTAADLTTHALPALDAETIAAVARPKVRGTQLLASHFPPAEMDFFVLFSSASTVFGPFGHGAYAPANAFVEGFARATEGVTAITWGVWEATGSAAQGVVDSFLHGGLEVIDFKSGLDWMEHLAATGQRLAAIIPGNYAQWKQWVPESVDRPLLAEFLQSEAESASGSRGEAFAEDSAEAVEQVVRATLAKVFRSDIGRMHPGKTLLELGLDSLMALELKNKLEKELDVVLTVAKLLSGPTIRQLARQLRELRQSDTGQEATETKATTWESVEI